MFNNNDLYILANINTTYEDIYRGSDIDTTKIVTDAGIVMSKSDVHNGSRGFAVGKLYAGSAMFNSLYAAGGTYKEFGWRTGWNKRVDGLGTYSCSLLFGLIPVSWSSGNIIDMENVSLNADYGVYWRNGYKDRYNRIHNYLASLGLTGQVVSGNGLYPEFQSLTDSSNPTYSWNNQSTTRVVKQLNVKPVNNIFYTAGLKENYQNNWQSIGVLPRQYTITGGSSRDGQYTFEKHAGISYLSKKYSVGVRFGSLLGKDNGVVYSTPVIGFFKNNKAGTGDPDTDNIITYKRNGTFNQNWSRDIRMFEQEANHPSGNNYYSNEYYFGAMNDSNNATLSHNFLFNSLLEDMYSGLDSTPKQRINNHQPTPLFMSGTYAADRFRNFNMFDVSTIKYKTNIPASLLGGYRLIDFIPIFAQSMSSGSSNDHGGPCCMIHTFQSIVYNTYCQDVFNPVTNPEDGLPYNTEENELTSPLYSVNTVKNFKQGSNTWSKYTDFVMKYNPVEHTMYLSYALKANVSNGIFSSVTEGPTLAEDTDWIAWINGNIWVIPNSLFSKHVFYTVSDYAMLENMNPQVLGEL